MNKHLQNKVAPFSITASTTAAEILSKMAQTSFQARYLGQSVQVWSQMLQDETIIFLGLAGAMVPAGMRKVITYLIQNRLIDCLVSTGANLSHDIQETMGHPHWQGNPNANDMELKELNIDRFYDVYTPDDHLTAVESYVNQFASTLPQDHPYTTREFLYRLGLSLIPLAQEDGILTSAAKVGVPIYCPAIGDSVIGIGTSAGRVNGSNQVMFDIIQDVVETTRLCLVAPSTGVIYIGGGTPKNFIQQAEVCTYIFDQPLQGHKYGVQITTDMPQWGGSSGCTFDEAVSWGKISASARTAIVNCDATIALPLVVSALAESVESFRSRKRPEFALAERELNVKYG